MIPPFPRFTTLSLADQTVLQNIIRSYPPHSDYNLASLWSYDTENDIQISTLHTNLVVIFRDYITNAPLYSVLGTTNISQTLSELLTQTSSVSLLAQETIDALPKSHDFEIRADRDNYDYILSVDKLMTMNGTPYLKKRTKVHAFERLWGSKTHTQTLDLTDPAIHGQILDLFDRWERERGLPKTETQREQKAIQKILSAASHFSLHGIGVYDGNTLIACAIDEVIHNDHGVTHFEKADTRYRGIYEYMKKQSAIHFHSLGCRYINLEQDLGIPGLRAAKLSYRPSHFVKKYTVTPRKRSG